MLATHRRSCRLLDAWVDGELDPATERAVAHHVHECWECSGAAETTRLVKASLAQLRTRRPPALAFERLRRWATKVDECDG